MASAFSRASVKLPGTESHFWKRFKAAASTTTFQLIACTILGFAVGVGIGQTNWSAENKSWVGFPGELFLRALKCLVIPMIFCNMVVGVAEISGLGAVGKVGSTTFKAYMSTTFFAALEGLVVVLLFRNLFKISDSPPATDNTAQFNYFCDSSYTIPMNTTGLCSGDSSSFYLNNAGIEQNNLFVEEAAGLQARTISDTLKGIARSLITDNLFRALWTPDILSVIVFAIAFGLCAAKLKLVGESKENLVLLFIQQLNQIIQNMVIAIINWAPLAVFFLVAGALSMNENLGDMFSNMGVVIAAVFVGHLFHVFLFLPSIFFLFVRKNPFDYMRQIIPAYSFAFGCASSAATLPITTKCVEETGEVDSSIAKFVLSLGATINMDGSGIYFPVCIIFLADSGGFKDQVDAGTLMLVLLVSTLGAIGASPIPNSGLVMILTIWEAVFPGVPIPPEVAYLQAIDWLLDRSVTVVNVCGDSVVARITQAVVGNLSEHHKSMVEGPGSQIIARMSMTTVELDKETSKQESQL